MATFSTSEFKGGLKVMIDGDPGAIIENEFVKPGKGQAFNRVKIRNLKTNRVIERTFKSGDTLEAADVVETDMQFLYNDGEFYHFMVPDTYEQFAATPEIVGDAAKWLKGQEMCVVTLCRPVRRSCPPSRRFLRSARTLWSWLWTTRTRQRSVIFCRPRTIALQH